MIRSRIIYIIFLVFCIAYYAVYSGWISALLLRLAVLMPVLSFVPVLISSFFMKGELSASEEGIQGRQLKISLTLNHRIKWMPVTYRIKLRIQNTFLETKKKKTYFLHEGEDFSFLLDLKHCGNIVIHIQSLQMLDIMGIFGFPIHKGNDIQAMVLPQNDSSFQCHFSHQQPLQYKNLPSGSFSEDHDLRPYVPGDSLNSIHWKLSSKTGDLIVRQPVEPVYPPVILTFDEGDDAEETDRILAKVQGLSDRLLDEGIFHYLAFVKESTFIDSHAAQKKAWAEVLKQKISGERAVVSSGIVYSVGKEGL